MVKLLETGLLCSLKLACSKFSCSILGLGGGFDVNLSTSGDTTLSNFDVVIGELVGFFVVTHLYSLELLWNCQSVGPGIMLSSFINSAVSLNVTFFADFGVKKLLNLLLTDLAISPGESLSVFAWGISI